MSATTLATETTPPFRLVALIVAGGLFMEQLDGTVLATALPSMARSFGTDPLRMDVALTAYLLSLAIFIPASGWAADRFGARTVFRAAIALFTLGSALCGQANGLTMLVASRVVQGIGGAMMVPVGRLILVRTVSRADYVAAMAWVLVPGLVGPVLGPPIGGFLVDPLSWRWIFYINLPIGLLGMVMASRFLRNFKASEPAPFDWTGFALSGLSLSCLLFGFDFWSHGVTTPGQTGAMLGTGLVSGAFYVWHARHAAHPLLDLRLMRLPSFGLSVVAGALTRITGGALPFLLPMMLQLGFGVPARTSGLITLSSAAGAVLMKAAGPRILRRWGFRNVLVWNGVLATSCLMSAAFFTAAWPIWAIFAVMLVGGFFQSLQFTAYNTVAYADTTAAQASGATSFYATFQQLMLSAGICLAASVLAAARDMHHHATPTLADFSVTWLVIGVITLTAAPICALLPKNVGDDMAGRA